MNIKRSISNWECWFSSIRNKWRSFRRLIRKIWKLQGRLVGVVGVRVWRGKESEG